MLKKGLSILALTMLVSTLVMVPVKSSSETYGPVMDKLLLKVIRNPQSQYTALTTREIDVMGPVVNPDLIEEAIADGKYVSSRPVRYWFRFVFNYRRIPICDVNFRHALLHLLDKGYILGTIFRFIYASLDSVVPRAFGEWYNPNVEKHYYSPAQARSILEAAGYVYSPAKNNWIMPYDFEYGYGSGIGWPDAWGPDGNNGTIWDGTKWVINDPDDVVPPIAVFAPQRVGDPTGCEAAESWVADMNAIGLTTIWANEMVPAGLPREGPLSEAVNWYYGGSGSCSDIKTLGYEETVYATRDFDIAVDMSSIDQDLRYLYLRFHTDLNYYGSLNPMGMWWDAPNGVDDQINIIKTNPSQPARREACWKLQGLLMGGSPEVGYMPWPSQANGWNRNDDWWNWSIPNAMVGIRSDYYITQPELKGLVNSMDNTILNKWTRLNMYWATDDGNRPGTTEKSVVWLVKEFPTPPLGPGSFLGEYSDAMLEKVIDPLVEGNPYPNIPKGEPWLATAWGRTPWTNPDTGLPGMVYWYTIRPGVKWQDGYDFTAEDVKFNWDFIKYWRIPKWWPSMKIVHHTAVEGPLGTPNPNGDIAAIYTTELNEWPDYMQKMYGGLGAIFPPQIYDRNWGSWDALASYKPESKTYGTDMADGSWSGRGPYGPGTMPAGATNLFGTGPWILVGLDPNYAWAQYVANRNYFISQEYIDSRLSYLFWRVGDTTKNGKVDISDLSKVAWAFYTWPGQPNWDPDADCTSYGFGPPEGKVDFVDLTVCGLYSGESKTVPPGSGSSGAGGAGESSTQIRVEPSKVTGLKPGDTFTIDVVIKGAENIYAWGFWLGYSPINTTLDCISVTGQKEFLGPDAFAPTAKIDWLRGAIYVSATLTGNASGVSGDGKLATITFKVTGTGQCTLDLYDTKLLTPVPNPTPPPATILVNIPHLEKDGYYGP